MAFVNVYLISTYPNIHLIASTKRPQSDNFNYKIQFLSKKTEIDIIVVIRPDSKHREEIAERRIKLK